MELKKSQRWYPYLLILPTMLTIGVILIYPMLKGFLLSFQNYVLTKPVPDGDRFIGIANYLALIKDEVFMLSLGKTLSWVFFSVVFQVLLGLLVALVLNQEFRFRALARGLVLIPWVLPSVVSALLWSWILDGTYGLLNDWLMKLGLIEQNIPWLAGPYTAFPSVIATNVWKGFPFFAISILAGMQTIPKDLYEAAEIDGAGAVRRFFAITLPHLKPVLMASTVLRLIWTANTTDLIFTMTRGGPGYTTNVLALYTYLKAWGELDFGYSSAMAMVLMVIMLAFIAFYMKLINNKGEAVI